MDRWWKLLGFFFLLRFLFGSMHSNENAKNEITKWTRFIIPRYRKCRIIRAIVTLAGIRVGQFMSEWLWIISAVGRIKLWYYISSFRPNCHTAPPLVPSLLSLSLFHTNFTRLRPPFYLFSPLEPILCQHVLIKKKYACKAINILYV